jgi:3',5'-cyclic AMP phosphodiesterase CpdA
MRVAHITDLHAEARPGLGDLFNKRAIGAANLYILGRAGHFAAAAFEACVARVVDLAPDAVVCSGDLTATGTDAEFELARARLRPILDRFAFVVIPGNHDVYTGESVGRFERHFGPIRTVVPLGEFDVVSLDVCHPDWLSRGWATDGALAAFDEALSSSERPAWVMLHYPLRGRGGQPYGPATRACANAAAIERLLGRHPRVRGVWHGHEHHGFRTSLGALPLLDPGASGYAFLPARRRTAHFNLYELAGGELRSLERWAFDGTTFEPEAGGAYATGG